MSRFDKYDGKVGGFRARLKVAITSADVGKIQAVSIESGTGLVVIGGATGDLIAGVIVPVRPMAANEPIDVMTAGEIGDATATGGTALTAGAKVYAHSTGVVDNSATASLLIGHTIEANRVVVRLSRGVSSAYVA